MQLPPEQIDALTEMINIGAGRAASVLNDMVHAHVALKVPTVLVMSHEEYLANPPIDGDAHFACVQLPFKSDQFSGRALLALPPNSAINLVAILIGSDEAGGDLDHLHISTLNEVGNIILNSVMGSISNVLGTRLIYSVPSYHNDKLSNLMQEEKGVASPVIIYAETWFSVTGKKIEGDILMLLGAKSADSLSHALSKFPQQK